MYVRVCVLYVHLRIQFLFVYTYINLIIYIIMELFDAYNKNDCLHLEICMYIYNYIYVCVYIFVYIFIDIII